MRTAIDQRSRAETVANEKLTRFGRVHASAIGRVIQVTGTPPLILPGLLLRFAQSGDSR